MDINLLEDKVGASTPSYIESFSSITKLCGSKKKKKNYYEPKVPNSYKIIIDHDANIFEYKLTEMKRDCKFEITVGDLHGNAVKFLYFLVREKAIKMAKEDFKSACKICYKDNDKINKEDLKKFNDLLNKIEFNDKAFVRLLGDELCDRGNNDYFVIQILKKLFENMKSEVLMSNHGLEFLRKFEKDKKYMANWCSKSTINLISLINRDIISKQDILDFINNNYKKKLKLISYTLDEASNSIMIYSHAQIGFNTIKALANELNINFKVDNINQLAKTIDKINDKIQLIISKKLLYKFSKFELAKALEIDKTNAPLSYALIRCIWSRGYNDKLDKPVTDYKGIYKLFYTHGHNFTDECSIQENNTINLDNRLGKGKNNEKETYTALYYKKSKNA